MFNFGFDPEQFASLGSSFDEPDPFAPTASTPTEEEAFNFLSGLQNTRMTAREDLGAGSYDPNDWDQIAMATPEMVENQRWGTATQNIYKDYTSDFKNYVEENNIPLTQVRDGVTYYLTGGNEGVKAEFGGRTNNFLHGRVNDGEWFEQGPVGTYSTTYLDTSVSGMNQLLNNPLLRTVAAVATNGISEGVIAAGRGLTGETLHLNDWASMAMADTTTAKATQEHLKAVLNLLLLLLLRVYLM